MSKKKWPIIREIQYKSGASAYMVDGRIGGKGKRHFFETKGEAETKAQQLRVARENEGAAAIKNFDERLRLRDAVEFYLAHLEATNRTCTIEELFERLLAAKKQDGMSNRYIGDLRSRIGQFARYFNEKRVSEFRFSEVDVWLRSLGVRITTRNNFRRALVVAFNFAKEHGYCTTNPAGKIKSPDEPKKKGVFVRCVCSDLYQRLFTDWPKCYESKTHAWQQQRNEPRRVPKSKESLQTAVSAVRESLTAPQDECGFQNSSAHAWEPVALAKNMDHIIKSPPLMSRDAPVM